MENKQPIHQKKQNKSLSRFVYSVLVTFAVVYLFGIFFGRIVYFPFQVKGASMQPTLNAQAASGACDTVYLSAVGNVERGDILVFDATNYTNVNPDEKYFIKRVVGLPGDTLFFATNGTEKNGKKYYDVFVNGVKMEESYIKEPMWYDSHYPTVKETNFYLYFIVPQTKIVLQNNQYFLLGDNRNNSTDSRILGPIEGNDLVGKVVLHIKANQTIFQALIQKIF